MLGEEVVVDPPERSWTPPEYVCKYSWSWSALENIVDGPVSPKLISRGANPLDGSLRSHISIISFAAELWARTVTFPILSTASW